MLVHDMFMIVVVTALISCLACILIVYSQKWHGKHSLDHDLDGVQKYHAVAVPRIGGIAVFLGILLSVLFFSFDDRAGFSSAYALPVILLLTAGLPAFVAGIKEDLTKRVSVKFRLVATITSALTASWLLGATVNSLDIWGVDSLLVFGPVALSVTALVVAGGSNAINIIDGFNGLAASVVAVMSLALAAVAWQVGDQLVMTFALLSCGASLGFLSLNFPTGRLFLGDGGAYLLGFWVSEIAVLLLVRNPEINAWQVLSICAYPVIEVLYSIYRRKIVRKSSPGAPDRMHLHTLVYRRCASRLISTNANGAWRQNAMVTCIVTPCVGALIAATVIVGHTFLGAIAIVSLQVAIYLKVYQGLVWGRWRWAKSRPLNSGLSVKPEQVRS